MTPAGLLLVTTARGCCGSVLEGRGGKPEFTLREAALALSGLHNRYYDAIAYRIAGDDQARSRLHSELTKIGRRLAFQEHWPKRVHERITDLSDLILDEERMYQHQRTPPVRCAILNISKSSYYRVFCKPYGSMASEFESWIGTAARTMWNRLRDSQ